MKAIWSYCGFVFLFAVCPGNLPAQYVDISAAAGIEYDGRDGGVAVGDFDADGRDDLYFSRWDGENKLFRNLGNGKFEDVTKMAGVGCELATRLAIWGDLNNDGYPELYLGNVHDPDILYRNNGDSTFTDISWEAGIYNPGDVFSVSMADIDMDGLLDIYVANFKAENKCYRNNGNLTFSDYTYRSGALSTRNAMATLFFDFDNDRDLDLYLVHDGQPNMFYENRGDGRFAEIGESAGVNDDGFGMGADAGDINNDGWLDLYVTNLFENVLYLNNGDGTFTDISKTAGVDDYGMAWGTNFLDFNNDGWLDIYVANDSYFSPYPNVLYENNGDKTFQVVEATGPVSSRLGGFGSACLDIDLDGRIDIALTNGGIADYNQLFHNQYSTGRWVGFRLEGVASNRDAVGARIEVWDDLGVRRIEEVAAGSSFAAQNTLTQHFGLGEASDIDSIQIRWPSGYVQWIGALETNQYYRVREGEAPEVMTVTTTSTEMVPTGLMVGTVSVFPNPVRERTTIQFRLDRPTTYRLAVTDALGREVRLLGQAKDQPGDHQLVWDGHYVGGRPAPTGLYFAVLTTGKQRTVVPLILQR